MTSPNRPLLAALALVLLAPNARAAPPPAPTSPGAGAVAPTGAPKPAPPAGDWRAARFGMTPEELLAAFPGEAFRLEPEIKLDDGNTVSIGIDGFAMDGLTFRVRFVFALGRLVLVSLRTDARTYVEPVAYDRLRGALVARWGAPVETTSNDSFIDMRQTRWNVGTVRADLKYIPGVIALVYYPRPGDR